MSSAFVDTHNMVAILTKSEASEGFDQIIDFLNGSYIKYALTSLSAKRTSWNEFSFVMASAVICLSTGDHSTHTTTYISPALTQKVFANMRRVGKGCSRVETPLFEGMLVAAEIKEHTDAEEQIQGNDNDAQGGDADVSRDDVQDQFIPSPAPPTPPPSPQAIPSTSHEALDVCAALTRRVEHLEHDKVAQDLVITKLKTRVKKLERDNKGRMIDELDRNEGVALMGEKEEEKKAEKVKEVVEVVTTAKLITEVVTAASTPVSAASTIIPAAELRVPAATITATQSKLLLLLPDEKEEWLSKIQKRNHLLKLLLTPSPRTRAKGIDWDVAIEHVKQKAKEDPFEQRLDYFKGMSYDDIRPIFEAKFNANMEFLLKSKEQIEEEENRALKSINETPAQKAGKRRKMNEDVEEIKQLEIVPDEDDDVYTEATPLAWKVPIVDYHIIHLNNKPRYKIIKADGTYQLYVSFITLLKNLDREDLESLWILVKEIFSTSNPNNFSDDYFLTTLRQCLENQIDKTIFRRVKEVSMVKQWLKARSCGNQLSAVKHKLMLLDTAAERRVNTANASAAESSEEIAK
uniref:Synaptobrevin, longin-like domain protein n=1 Tax=Tanacetum cinerariifolium TaxID=118510 RepID=A0A6L2KRS5_TANCI|nr:hypothetical protein [Tanacetum cinerariifolium]